MDSVEQEKAQSLGQQREQERQHHEDDRRYAAGQLENWLETLAAAPRPPQPIPAVDPLLKLRVPKFHEGIDDVDVFHQMIEVIVGVETWSQAQWAVYLTSTLAGAGLSAVTSLSVADQGDYDILKNFMLAT